MKGYLYYAVALSANVVFMFVFRQYLNITEASVVPLLLIALSLFQAIYFHRHRSTKDSNTSYGSDFTEEECAQMFLYIRNSYIICIPLFLPFIWFFSSWIKLLSVFIFFTAFTGGAFFYRIKYKKRLEQRVLKEREELEEQKKKESLGRWN